MEYSMKSKKTESQKEKSPKSLLPTLIKFLENEKITGEDRTKVLNALLKNLHAVPIHNVIAFDKQGSAYIRGKKLDPDLAMQVIASIEGIKENFALRLVEEQLTYDAIAMGVHNGLNPETIQFAKAILWVLQQKKELFDKLTPANYV